MFEKNIKSFNFLLKLKIKIFKKENNKMNNQQT